MIKSRLYTFLVVALTLVGCNSTDQESDIENIRPELINYNQPLSSLIDNDDIIQVNISKSEYTLTIKKGSQIIKQYPVVFGKNAIDDKKMEGDYCTPEGQFNMRDKYPHRKWNKFIWLNYPTQDSYKKHKKAKNQGQIPENATVGSEIGIHGVPEGKNHWVDDFENWTWGCISMKNNDLDEIYPYISSSTPILIK